MAIEKIVGEAFWIKETYEKRDFGWENQAAKYDGQYVAPIKVDEETFNRIDSWGIGYLTTDSKTRRLKSPDDNGLYTVKFNRKHKGPFAEASGPPRVTGDYDPSVGIWNGSKVELTLDVYNTKSYGKHVRLVAINVLEKHPDTPEAGVSEPEVTDEDVEDIFEVNPLA